MADLAPRAAQGGVDHPPQRGRGGPPESALSSFAPTQRLHSITFAQDGRLLAADGAGREQSIKGIGLQETTGDQIRLIDPREER